MLRITRQTDYGIVVLTNMAAGETGAVHAARDVAAEAGLPLPMVSKTLKSLAREGILLSHRGVNGGYSLARPADEISMAEIITALEGPIAMTECSVEETGNCEQEGQCPAQANWIVINRAIQVALEKISLKDMIHPLPRGRAPVALATVLPAASAGAPDEPAKRDDAPNPGRSA